MIPEYMTPWIYTHAIAITIEMGLWLMDQWFGQEHFNLKIFIEFVCSIMGWVIVCCLQQTFIMLLQNPKTKGFSLFQP